MSDDNITISIPKLLANKIEKRLKKTGFDSVSSYVTYILKEVLTNIETQKEEEFSTENKEEKEAFTEDEERIAKERLKSLGYLD